MSRHRPNDQPVCVHNRVDVQLVAKRAPDRAPVLGELPRLLYDYSRYRELLPHHH